MSTLPQLPALPATVLRLHIQPKLPVVGTALPCQGCQPTACAHPPSLALEPVRRGSQGHMKAPSWQPSPASPHTPQGPWDWVCPGDRKGAHLGLLGSAPPSALPLCSQASLRKPHQLPPQPLSLLCLLSSRAEPQLSWDSRAAALSCQGLSSASSSNFPSMWLRTRVWTQGSSRDCY